MDVYEPGGRALGKIHRAANDRKYFCYFTGFLEGIVASGTIEQGEVEPLIAQCEDFILNVSDNDASDILEDFKADLLEHAALVDAAVYRLREIDPQCSKSASNRFLGFCAGISCDGIITNEEAEVLAQKFEETPSLSDDTISRNLRNVCTEALDDGIIDSEESLEICAAISRLVGDAYSDTGIAELGNIPVFDYFSICSEIDSLVGATAVLTGNFSIRPRRILEDGLRERGCQITKSVSRKTDFVVVATEASRDWVHTHKGTKIIKAIKLREENSSPRFVDEADLLRALNLR